jgi:signal transduction histidine kinase
MKAPSNRTAAALYRDWREPIWGTVLADILVAGDIVIGSLELPRSLAYHFVVQAIQGDVLRLAILFLGPTIGFILRHFRVKQERLFKDIVDTIIYILDHEIRNPLMMIMGASTLMKESSPDDTRRLRQVGEAVDRIVETLSSLSAMANITASKFYNIRDHLKNSTTPAKDLRAWGTPTTIMRKPPARPTEVKEPGLEK